MNLSQSLNFVPSFSACVSARSSSYVGQASHVSCNRAQVRSDASMRVRVGLARTRSVMQATGTASETHTVDGKEIAGSLEPVGQNILVKVGDAEEKTSGGIILPDEAQEKPTFGEVVAVGPGKFLGNGVKIPMDVAPGDSVMYGKYGGTELKYDGVKHTIVTQDDVLCKFDGGQYTAGACRLIYDRVLVKLGEPKDETVGGIVLTSGASKAESQNSGEVVALGKGRFMENGELEPQSIDIGDTVYYSTYAGTNVTLEGVEYAIIRVADIYAKA